MPPLCGPESESHILRQPAQLVFGRVDVQYVLFVVAGGYVSKRAALLLCHDRACFHRSGHTSAAATKLPVVCPGWPMFGGGWQLSHEWVAFEGVVTDVCVSLLACCAQKWQATSECAALAGQSQLETAC